MKMQAHSRLVLYIRCLPLTMSLVCFLETEEPVLARIERSASDSGLLGSLLIHYTLFCSIGKDTRLKVNRCFPKLSSPVSLPTKHSLVSIHLTNIVYYLYPENCQIKLRETIDFGGKKVCKYRTQNTDLMLGDNLRFIQAELWSVPTCYGREFYKHS